MADKEPDELMRKGSYLLDPVSKNPRDQSQGFEIQNTQPDELPAPTLELEEILPKEYEWKVCDMSSDREASEVSSFIKKYYLQNNSRVFEFKYSKDFLQWSLCPPGFYKNWHIGVEEKSTKQLVAFIAAVPLKIRLHGEVMCMAEVKYLYVLEQARPLGLQKLLIKRMAEVVIPMRARVAYATPGDFLTMPLASCKCWIRPLKVTKLLKERFIRLPKQTTIKTEAVVRSLPMYTQTRDLRKMVAKDIPSVTTLLRSYMGRFAAAPIFTEPEVGHWFLPRENVLETYVVEENKRITHFISFAILPFSTPWAKGSTINSACSLYNVSPKVQNSVLLMDALILARLQGLDVFKVIDIMDNDGPVLEDLMFRECNKQYYCLHGNSPSKELEPSQVGFVMF